MDRAEGTDRPGPAKRVLCPLESVNGHLRDRGLLVVMLEATGYSNIYEYP